MDLYDKAIEYLKSNPDQIMLSWDDPKSHFTGILFQAVTPDGYASESPDGFMCGDICQIKALDAHAWTSELQEEIAKDPNIPVLFASNNKIPKITVHNLEIFANWQRKIDKALNRNPENFQVVV